MCSGDIIWCSARENLINGWPLGQFDTDRPSLTREGIQQGGPL